MPRRALITGSFDPITSGHADLICRAAGMFDEVVVAVLSNGKKSDGTFSPEDRVRLIEAAVRGMRLDGVRVVCSSELTSNLAREVGAKYLVRGARNATDFDYENNLAAIMKRFDENLETVILPTSPCLAAVSSTYVRELLRFGCPLDGAVPEGCEKLTRELYGAGKTE